jgi:hypothetical protein
MTVIQPYLVRKARPLKLIIRLGHHMLRRNRRTEEQKNLNRRTEEEL